MKYLMYWLVTLTCFHALFAKPSLRQQLVDLLRKLDVDKKVNRRQYGSYVPLTSSTVPTLLPSSTSHFPSSTSHLPSSTSHFYSSVTTFQSTTSLFSSATSHHSTSTFYQSTTPPFPTSTSYNSTSTHVPGTTPPFPSSTSHYPTSTFVSSTTPPLPTSTSYHWTSTSYHWTSTSYHSTSTHVPGTTPPFPISTSHYPTSTFVSSTTPPLPSSTSHHWTSTFIPSTTPPFPSSTSYYPTSTFVQRTTSPFPSSTSHISSITPTSSSMMPPFPSDKPPFPSDLPPIPGIINHRLRNVCPVLSDILPYYFEHFPSGSFKDSIHIGPEMFRDTFRDMHTIFRISRNTQVFVDELTTEMAEVIVHEKFQCPATKLQQAFVYILRKELDVALSHNDGSLKSNLTRWLSRKMNEPDFFAGEIVRFTHTVLFEELIGFIQMEEFRELSTFMARMSKKLSNILREKKDWNKLMRFVSKQISLNKDAWICTTPAEFKQMHVNIAKEFQERMTKDVLTQDSLVVVEAELKGVLMELGHDPNLWSIEIIGILNELTSYILNGVLVFQQYEEALIYGSQLGDDFYKLMEYYLSPYEIGYFKTLWTHVFMIAVK